MAVIQIFNQSSVVNADELEDATEAVQVQINRDFSKFWPARTLQIVSEPDPNNYWVCYIVDSGSVADALGFHNLNPLVTNPYCQGMCAGQPQAFVFAQTSMQSGVPWSGVYSHEILEMLANPCACTSIKGKIPAQRNHNQWVVTLCCKEVKYPLEVCDPVESDYYKIGRWWVSDFVLPSWFQDSSWGKVRSTDFLERIKDPHFAAPGGYFIWEMKGQEHTTFGYRKPGGPKLKRRSFSTPKPLHDLVQSIHERSWMRDASPPLSRKVKML